MPSPFSSLGPLPHSVHRIEECSLNEQLSNIVSILIAQWVASGLIYCLFTAYLLIYYSGPYMNMELLISS